VGPLLATTQQTCVLTVFESLADSSIAHGNSGHNVRPVTQKSLQTDFRTLMLASAMLINFAGSIMLQ